METSPRMFFSRIKGFIPIALMAALIMSASILPGGASVQAQEPPPQDWVRVGYIAYAYGGGWPQFSQLFDGTYTHILSAFYLPNTAGNLSPVAATETFTPALRQQAQAAGSKVMFSIGGSTIHYSVYVAIADNPTARQNFINNTLSLLQSGGYDGVDFNFEGWDNTMTTTHRDKILGLMSDAAIAVKNANPAYVTSTALAALYYLPMSANCALINSPQMDYAHYMGYSFYGSSGPNGPWRQPGTILYLYPPGSGSAELSVYGALTYLQSQGCNMRKITGGMPYYATNQQAWNNVRNAANWPAIALHPDYLEKQHPSQGYWVHDPEAISAKVTAYRDFGVGGVMVWQVGHEGPLRDLSAAFVGGTPPPSPTPGTPTATRTPSPTPGPPTATPTPGPTNTPAPGGSYCAVEYQITSDWGTGFGANVVVTNRSAAAWNSWTVTWTFPGNQQITSLWNGVYTQTGQSVEVRNASWNGSVAAGASVSFGFNASYSGANDVPTDLRVNGVDCNAP